MLDLIGNDVLSRFSTKSSKMCRRCENLDFWESLFHIEETITNLKLSADNCQFCGLVLNACRLRESRSYDSVRFVRDGSNIKIDGYNFPVLSIYKSPSMC